MLYREHFIQAIRRAFPVDFVLIRFTTEAIASPAYAGKVSLLINFPANRKALLRLSLRCEIFSTATAHYTLLSTSSRANRRVVQFILARE